MFEIESNFIFFYLFEFFYLMESQIPDPDRSRDRDPRPETSIVNLKFPGRPKAVLGERFWRDINVRGGVIAVNACDSGSWEVVVQIWVGMGKGECKGKGRMKMKIENEDWHETLWRG